MSVRDTVAQFGLSELKRSEVTIYRTREDYREQISKEAPLYNPALPNKYWAWIAPAAGKSVTFLVPEILDDRPVLGTMALPLSYAQSVNIPHGEANAEPTYSTETLPFPVEPLRPDEYLALGFGGIIVVRNRTRFVESVEGFEQQVLTRLQAINNTLAAIRTKLNT